MFRRSKFYLLGRVTRTARSYLALSSQHGELSPATRAAGHAYTMACRNALAGGADLTEVAFATGLPVDPPATFGVHDVDLLEVRAELDTPLAVAS